SAVKRGNRKLHENLIKVCMACSVAFLLLYVAYHMTSESTPYGGEGIIRYVYFVILISHILLSIIIIPFVLFTFVRGIAGAYDCMCILLYSSVISFYLLSLYLLFYLLL